MLTHLNLAIRLGYVTLLLAPCVTTYAIVAATAGARLPSRRLILSATIATYASCLLLTLVSAAISLVLLSEDSSITNIHAGAYAGMPWIYKLGSYWGGLDGSRMFWVWLLSTFAAIAIRQSRDRHRELIPYAIAILMVILDFFVILVIFYDRPFDTLLAEVPMIGKGLNPLLQHRYMPGVPPFVPLLYAGYVSASIPFAFGMAVLISGNLDEPWPQSARRWMQLCCWSLSLGLLLCSMWTYRVVGWGVGGSWDPAQNQLMWPWLTATAFLGSIKIQKRRGTLTVWNVLLLILTFLLSTFRAARSGEMLSIHAFGWDPKLDACFLVFLGVCGTLGFGLLLLRLPATGNR